MLSIVVEKCYSFAKVATAEIAGLIRIIADSYPWVIRTTPSEVSRIERRVVSPYDR